MIADIACDIYAVQEMVGFEVMTTHLTILYAAWDSVHESGRLGYAKPYLGHLTTGVY